MVFFVDGRAECGNISAYYIYTQHDTTTAQGRTPLKSVIDTNLRLTYRKIYGLLVSKREHTEEIIEEHSPTERFEKYSNKQIAEIQLIRLKAFGQSVHDLNKKPEEWDEKLGNVFHTVTQRRVITHNLLFRVDEQILHFVFV